MHVKSLSRLALHSLTTLGDALEDLLTVLVELELGDDDLGGGDGDGDALAVGLLADDTYGNQLEPDMTAARDTGCSYARRGHTTSDGRRW